MGEVIRLLGVLLDVLRSAYLWVLLAAAGIAAAAWAERTRRVSAFGPVARYARQYADRLIHPIEQRVVRFGGTRTTAPWWWFLAVLILGAGLISLVGFIRSELAMAHYAIGSGTPAIVRLLVGWTFTALQLAVFVRVLMTWIGGSGSALGRLCYRMTEWMLAPLRRVIPAVGRVDITPIVAWFGLALLQGFVLRVL
jgi:YggT family protein